MQNLPSDAGLETAYDVSEFTENARDKTCSLVKSGQEYVKKNPIPVVLGAFLVGAAVGALVLRREREEETDKLKSALHWLEGRYSDLADRVPKKSFFSCDSSKILDQAQDLGKKLKWW